MRYILNCRSPFVRNVNAMFLSLMLTLSSSQPAAASGSALLVRRCEDGSTVGQVLEYVKRSSWGHFKVTGTDAIDIDYIIPDVTAGSNVVESAIRYKKSGSYLIPDSAEAMILDLGKKPLARYMKDLFLISTSGNVNYSDGDYAFLDAVKEPGCPNGLYTWMITHGCKISFAQINAIDTPGKVPGVGIDLEFSGHGAHESPMHFWRNRGDKRFTPRGGWSERLTKGTL